MRPHLMSERFPFHIAHDEEDIGAQFVGPMHGYDVGMSQRRRCSGLAQKALANRDIGCQMVGQRLDRHLTIQLEVSREIHDSHSPPANFTLQAILPR